MNNDNSTARAILAQSQQKSTALGVVLAILFGGLGLLYASIAGGIIMAIVEGIVVIIGFLTLGFGLLLLIPVHIITVIWALVSISGHNKKIVQEVLNSGK